METSLPKARVITELTRSPHRDLAAYLPVGRQAVLEDPDFFAHLVAWNHLKGDIRDAKCALPMLALEGTWAQGTENAFAHLADLNPRMLVKALDFGTQLSIPKRFRAVRGFVERYLRDLEADRRDFESTAVQHRASLRRLYAAFRIKPSALAETAVLKASSVEGKFGVVKMLPFMSPLELVAAIDKHKLPWLIVRGALGAKAKDPDVLMALIGRMTAADLATSAKWMLRAGVKDHPHTRAAFEQLLEKAVKPKKGKAAKGTPLKTGKAAKVLQDLGEERLAGKLHAVQEKQLDQRRTVEGRWSVLVDKSGSMQQAIGLGVRVAEVLGRLCKGDVHLTFFDTAPRYLGNVSGKSLQALEMATAGVAASGGTAIGCGVVHLADSKIEVDGIAIVSDGGERHMPDFCSAYKRYTERMGVQPTVYFYKLQGDQDVLSLNAQHSGVDLQTFDLTGGQLDDYSIPTLAETMRVGRYQLLDEVWATPLRTVDEVLTRTVRVHV